ncbi:MAG: hypothetical protein AB1599_04590 [Planctomycetota bacterium]
MPKQVYSAVIVILLVCFYQHPAVSETADESQKTNYKVSVTEWITTGNFKMYGGPPNALNTWKLAHPLDSDLTDVSFTYTPPEDDTPYRIHLSLGGGSLLQGTIRDTDWDANGVLQYLSYSESNGDVTDFSLSLDYRVTDPGDDYRVDLMFGYDYLKISANYRDALTTVWNYTPVITPSVGKWQVYNLLFQGIEAGAKARYDVLSGLFVETSAGFSPFVRAQYKGIRYPNTIYKQREHILAKGNAFDGEASVNYDISRRFSVKGGYRYQTYRTKGKDQPNTPWAGSWDELTSNFKGIFFGVDWKF